MVFWMKMGEGNDGVPIASEMPILPGESRTCQSETKKSRNKCFIIAMFNPISHRSNGSSGFIHC